MTYYMTQRPPMLGAMPKEGLVDWAYLDTDGEKKVFCEKIGCEAYAKLEYSRELTEREISDYELVPETRTVRLTPVELRKLIAVVHRAGMDAPDDEADDLYALYKTLLKAN